MMNAHIESSHHDQHPGMRAQTVLGLLICLGGLLVLLSWW
jgi:hypothetical protein